MQSMRVPECCAVVFCFCCVVLRLRCVVCVLLCAFLCLRCFVFPFVLCCGVALYCIPLCCAALRSVAISPLNPLQCIELHYAAFSFVLC